MVVVPKGKGPCKQEAIGNTLLKRDPHQTGNLHDGQFGDRSFEQLLNDGQGRVRAAGGTGGLSWFRSLVHDAGS